MIHATDPATPRTSTRASVVALAAAALSIGAPAALGQPQPTVGPQVRIDPGGGTAAANETTVSASEANPNHIVAGWNDWRPSGAFEVIRSGFSLSLDGGQTWSDFLLRPPAQNQSDVEGDPMTAFDARTGMLWAGAISFSAGSNSGIYVARKNAGESIFGPAVMARQTSGTDKPWMVAGPRPGVPDSTRLYIAYNEGVIRSDDLGQTWTTPVSLGAGVGFLPRIGPDGILYIAYWDYDDGVKLKRSTNGGVSFTTRTIATRMDVWSTGDGARFGGTFRVPPLSYMDVDRTTGTLYAAYFDTTSFSGGNANVDVYFTKSTDQGDTWDTPVVANGDGFPAGDQFFPWIEVDRNGRLHMVYFDSRHQPVNDNTVNAFFDAYYAYSVNDGATWSEHRLTPESWNSENDGLDRPTQFIGDYLGLSVAGNKAFPVYIDTSAGDTDTFTNVIAIPIPGDVNGDGFVNFADLLAVLSNWGPCGDPQGCDEDLDGSGTIDFFDLLEVLSNWT